MRALLLSATTALYAACTPVTFTQLEPEPNQDADPVHAAGQKGYVIYPPVATVSVTDTEENGCQMSGPTLLPDYSRPYRIDLNPSLFNTNVNIDIADGWRLDSMNSQQQANELVSQQLPFTQSLAPDSGTPSADLCRDPGLYRWVPTGGDAPGKWQRVGTGVVTR